MRTVREPQLADRDREVERERRLAHAALGREDRDHPGDVPTLSRDLRRLVDLLEPGHELVAGERHREDAVDALARVRRRPGSGARSGR